MSHDEATRKTEQKLVYMANQIATFFEAMPPDEAATGVADHLNKFWEPRMRRQLLELAQSMEEEFRPLVLEALSQVRLPEEAAT